LFYKFAKREATTSNLVTTSLTYQAVGCRSAEALRTPQSVDLCYGTAAVQQSRLCTIHIPHLRGTLHTHRRLLASKS